MPHLCFFSFLFPHPPFLGINLVCCSPASLNLPTAAVYRWSQLFVVRTVFARLTARVILVFRLRAGVLGRRDRRGKRHSDPSDRASFGRGGPARRSLISTLVGLWERPL